MYWSTTTFRYFQPFPGQRKKLYEVFFPNQFEQCHPWSSEPDSEWTDDQRRILGNLTVTNVPILRVSHVTHNREAREINRSPEEFTFICRQKLGKGYVEDGSPLGESYREDARYKYRKIPETDPVLPGYYSWWGISLSADWEEDTEDPRRKLEREEACYGGTYLANYLKEPVESCYGNNEYSTTFKNILQCYANSRHCSVEEIYLKLGGTLRYKQEICYVIVVCTQADLRSLSDFENLTPNESEVFNPKGLLNAKGRIKNRRAVPVFKTRYPVTYCEGKSCSWENMAFAFYFPSGDQVLRCPRDTTTLSKIRHGHPYAHCTSTYPLRHYIDGSRRRTDTEWKCRNKITDQERAVDKEIRESEDDDFSLF